MQIQVLVTMVILGTLGTEKKKDVKLFGLHIIRENVVGTSVTKVIFGTYFTD